MGTICSTQERNEKCARNVDRLKLIWVPRLTLRPSDDLLPTKLPLLPLLLLLFLLLLLLLLLLTSLAVIASQIVCLRNRESRWKINYHFTRKFWLLGAVTANKSRRIFDMPQTCSTAVASPHSDILCCTHERARCRDRWERALVPHCEKQPGRSPPHLAAQGQGNRTRHKKPRETDEDTKRNGHTEIWNDEKQTYVNIRLWEADRSRYEETRNRSRRDATRNGRTETYSDEKQTEPGNEDKLWDREMKRETELLSCENVRRQTEISRDGNRRAERWSDRKHTEAGNDEKRTRDRNRRETEGDANCGVADGPIHRPTRGESGGPRYEVTRYRHSETDPTMSVVWNTNINDFDCKSRAVLISVHVVRLG